MSEKHVDIERATESTFAKAMTRFGMPVLITVLGFLGTLLLQDIRSGLDEVKKQQNEQAEEVKAVSSDVKVLNAKLDNGVIWRITEIERRLNTVEQAQKTP